MIKSFLMCCLFLNALFSVALAGPEGVQLVNGQVSIQQGGYNTTITASDKAIINYSSFDIARPEVVQFIQPNSSASVLNRINSQNPTNINGTLLANGRVFFVNPAGVYIGEGARVNVNQLVASSLNITNSDFINGRFNFEGGNGSVINEGDITAEKVYLIGKEVINSGSIHCPSGYVIMAAGDRVFLSEPGSNVMVEIDPQTSSDPVALADSGPGVLNQDEVDTSGSRIVLAAGDIHTQAISNVGSLAASIEIDGAGQVSNTGTIETMSNTENGGTVIAKAAEVINSGTVDVTGSEGGKVAMEAIGRLGQFGTIHADGTDSHGGSVELTASEVVALSSDSVTTANAETNGDGGQVIVYSPDTALFNEGAQIEAKGGSESGDGGFVEVSGKEHVEVLGLADVRANNGDGGTFFIDPHNVTIKDDTGALDGGGNPFVGGSDVDTVSDDAIEGVINTGGAAVVQTSGGGMGDRDIVQDAGATIDFTGAGGNASLTLNAADDVELNGGIAVNGATAALNVTINANGDYDNASGSGDVDINADIATNGGSFTSSGIDFDCTGDMISTNGGKVGIQNTGDVTIGAEINVGEGDVVIDGGSSVARNIISSGGIIKSSGAITLEASGNIGIEGAAIDTVSTGTINASSTVVGDIYIDNIGAVTLGTVNTTSSDIAINNIGNLSINSITAGGGGDVTLNSTGEITTRTLSTATGDIFVRSLADLILKGPVTSGGGIALDSTEGNIVFYDSGPGLTPIITDGGSVHLATSEIYSHGNNENSPLGIKGATALTLFDTGPGSIELAEVGGSTIGSTSIAVADIGYGTIDITYDNERGWVDIDNNHVINSVDQPFSFSYIANKGDISINSITTATGDIVVQSSLGDLMLNGPVTSSGGKIALVSFLGNIEAQALTATDNIFVQSTLGNLILNGPVTSGGGIALESIEGNIVFYDSDPGLTPIITDGGPVFLSAGEIYSYGNNENSPLRIKGATELTLIDTGPGPIELAEVGGSTIGSTSITVGDIGYGTIDITYDNERGLVDIDDNHVINSVDQPFSFSYIANKGEISIDSITTATGDIFVQSIFGDLFLYGPVTSGGGIALESFLGNIEAKELTANGGNISVQSLGDLVLNGPVSAEGGGVKLISDFGKIYTHTSGGADHKLNVAITGYSDRTKGVDLPFANSDYSDRQKGVDVPHATSDYLAKAAIFIKSSDELKLGPGAILTAHGNYQTIIDDRQGILVQSTGDQIDVAIYVNSAFGSVTVDSPVWIYPGSTMVIHTSDIVNYFGEDFENCWTFNAGKNRLELISQQILDPGQQQVLDISVGEAVNFLTLPYAKEVREGKTPPWFWGSAYVLRWILYTGYGLEGRIIQETVAMARPVSPPCPIILVPLVSESLAKQDIAELMSWLEQEGIAPYLEVAHSEILSTNLRFVKAANQLRDYAAILRGTTDEQIEELIEMLLYIVDHPVPIDSSINWFHKRLQTMRPPDEPLYSVMGGEWIDALIGYAKTLKTEFGWPINDCVEKAMRDYIIRLKTDDHRFFVKQYLLGVLTADSEDETIFANLIEGN